MFAQSKSREIFASMGPLTIRPWRELSAFSLMVTELSLIVFCYRALSSAGRMMPASFVFTILGSLLLFANFLTRIMYFIRIRTSVRRGLTLMLLTGSWLFALNQLLYGELSLGLVPIIRRTLQAFGDPSIFFPPEFGVILIVLLIWSRGVLIAQHWMSAQVVVRSFRVGAFVFLSLALLQSVPWREVLGVEFHVFLLSGLIGMGAGRTAELAVLRGSRVNRFDRSGLLGVGIGASLLVVVALVVADFASTYLAKPTAQLAVLIAEGIVFLIILILSPFIFLFLVLIRQLTESVVDDMLTWLSEAFRLSAIREFLAEVFQFLLALLSRLEEILLKLWRLLREFREIKPLLLGSAILLAITFLLVLLGRRWRTQISRRRRKEVRQSIFDLGEFTRQLQATLRRGVNRVILNIQRVRQGSRLLAAARIRRIYSQLMRMCEELESPRSTAQTPMEFLSTLDRLFPNRNSDLAYITEAYQRVRYGELPETRDELAQVEAAWRVVRIEGEILRRDKKIEKKG